MSEKQDGDRIVFIADGMIKKIQDEVVKTTGKLSEKYKFQYDEEDANNLSEMVVGIVMIFRDAVIDMLKATKEKEEKEDGNA